LTTIFTVVEVRSFPIERYRAQHFPPQFRWVSKDYPMYDQLRIAYIMKAVITSILIILAIALGICMLKKLGAARKAKILFFIFFVHRVHGTIYSQLSWNGSPLF
jgi:hypothetical protein